MHCMSKATALLTDLMAPARAMQWRCAPSYTSPIDPRACVTSVGVAVPSAA